MIDHYALSYWYQKTQSMQPYFFEKILGNHIWFVWFFIRHKRIVQKIMMQRIEKTKRDFEKEQINP